jgi:hypothetical protein
MLVQNGVLRENLNMSTELLSTCIDVGNEFIAWATYYGRHDQRKRQVHGGLGTSSNAFDDQVKSSQCATLDSFCEVHLRRGQILPFRSDNFVVKNRFRQMPICCHKHGLQARNLLISGHPRGSDSS